MPEFTDDQIDVANVKLADSVGGAKPEPEEAPVVRKLHVVADASGSLTGEKLGSFKTIVSYDMEAQTVAQMQGKPCHQCKWWSQELWRNKVYPRFRSKPRGSDEQIFLNSCRARFDDDTDESMLTFMGVCGAMTDIYHDKQAAKIDPETGERILLNRKCGEQMSHRNSSCPEEGPDGLPMPMLFVHKDADARALDRTIYDSVLRIAQGKK